MKLMTIFKKTGRLCNMFYCLIYCRQDMTPIKENPAKHKRTNSIFKNRCLTPRTPLAVQQETIIYLKTGAKHKIYIYVEFPLNINCKNY
jgi:hypothetical protein